MRVAFFVFFLMGLLVACAGQDRIYEMHELDEPPVLVGDSLVFEAIAPRDSMYAPPW